MNKKYKKFTWLLGLSLLVIIGLSSTMFGDKNKLSAKKEPNVVEKSEINPSITTTVSVNHGGYWRELSPSETNLSQEDFDKVSKVRLGQYIVLKNGSKDNIFDNYFCIDYDTGLNTQNDKYTQIPENEFINSETLRSLEGSKENFKKYRSEITWLLDNFYYGDEFSPDYDTVRNRQIMTQLAIWNFTNPDNSSIKEAVANIPQIQNLVENATKHGVTDGQIYKQLEDAEYEMTTNYSTLQKTDIGYEAVIDLNVSPEITGYYITEDTTSSIKVTVNGTEVASSNETYTIDRGNNSFAINFNKDYYDQMANNTEIIVSSERTIIALEPLPIIYGYGNSQPITTSRRQELKTVIPTSVSFNKENLLGNVELLKFDIENKNQTLSGAKFDLYKEGESTPIKTNLTTDSTGKLTVSELAMGDYYFVETQAPDGYETPQTPNNRWDFSITQSDITSGKAVEVSASNKKLKKEIILTKTDADTGDPLPDVTFIIQSSYLFGWNNQYIVTGVQRKKFITDENGQIIINDQTYPGVIDQLIHDYVETDPNTGDRVPGYRFREIAAPEGYRSPEDPGGLKIEDLDAGKEFSVEIDIEALLSNNSQTLTYSLENYREAPRGSVRLYKYDNKNENIGLEGAEFSLYKEDGTLLRTGLKTNSEGILLVSDLSFGKYYFVETKAPDGYFLNDRQYSFEITEEHVEVSLEIQVSNVKAPPRELTLTKIDEETGDPIPDVEFIIQNKNTFFNQWGPVDTGSNNAPLITDKDGRIIINDTTYPGLIDHLIDLNSRSDVDGLRFREISTPDGWEDPYPTGNGNTDAANDLLANHFSKDIPMDSLIGSPLFDDPIELELTMTNKKETSDNSIIRVEKRDKTNGNLITNGEATFIIQSLNEDNQWSLFGKERTFKTINGVAVIEDEELINELLSYQGEPNDQKYRFREIEAPAGYKDPQAPNPLGKKEPQGGIGDEFSKEFVLDKENPETVTVVIENEKPEDPVDPTDRTVSLKKVDEYTDAPLSGAEFIIEKYDSNSKTWKKVNSKTYTTNNKGLIELTEDDIQSFGTDYPIYIAFRETKAPEGYELPENTYTETITITVDRVSPEIVTKENSRIDVDLEFTLRKVDGFSNMPLEDAGFQLYKEDKDGDFILDGPDYYYYTEADGQYVFSDFELSQLEPGNYKLKEVDAPEGYELPDDPFTEVFTISPTGVTPDRLVKKNYKDSDFMLKKIDQNGQPVKGAKFDLYKYPGPGATGTPEIYWRFVYITDENGEIIIDQWDLEELDDGVYFWRETEAPEGYEILEEDTDTFTIQNGKANPPLISHVNQYDGRLLKVFKVDDRYTPNGNNEYSTGLTGAVFELEKQNRNNWEIVQDKDGKNVSFTTESIYDEYGEVELAGVIMLNDHDIEKYELSNGTYRFREITPPPGYELPVDPYTPTFEIKDKAITPEKIVKKNSRLSDRELTLKKVDGRDQNLRLAGAKFEFEYTWGEPAGETNHEFTTYKKWNATTQKLEPVIFTTDENGEIIFIESQIFEIYGVGDGKCRKGRFKEVQPPEGYLLPDDVYTEIFEIRAIDIVDLNGRPITELKKVNYKAVDTYEMELLKLNDNEVRLDGAEFTLVPSDGSGQPQVSTGELGIFNFKDLEPDVEYTLTETKAPDDYFINRTPYTFILRTDEDPDGILEVRYNGKLLEEGKDYQWNDDQLRLSLVIINRKSSMPITGSIGILGLLIAGATAIGLAYNFQLKKKKPT